MNPRPSLTHVGHLRVAAMTHMIGYLSAHAAVQDAEGQPRAAEHTRGAMTVVHAQRAALMEQLAAIDDAVATARFMQLQGAPQPATAEGFEEVRA